MANTGWIKLHRKIENSWIWEDPEKLKAWLDILLMVNHEDREIVINGKPVVIHAGQRFTSLAKLARRWGWTRRKVERFLGTLTGTGMVTATGTRCGTLLTIENWALYQGGRDTKRDNNGDTNGDADGAQTRMNKNIKKEEVYRASAPFLPPTVEEVAAYCRERNNQIDAEGFWDYYAARGWKLSKGAPMKDWKAAVRYWETREKSKQPSGTKFSNFEGRQQSEEEMNDLIRAQYKRMVEDDGTHVKD